MEIKFTVLYNSITMMYIPILVLVLVNISNGRTVEDRILVETLPGRHPMVPYTHMAIAKSGGAEANLITDKVKPQKDKSPEELAPGPEIGDTSDYEDWYDYDYGYGEDEELPTSEDGDIPVEVVALEDGGEVVEIVVVEGGEEEPEEVHVPDEKGVEEVENGLEDEEYDYEAYYDESEDEVDADEEEDGEVLTPEDSDLTGNDTEEATYDIIEEIETKGAELDEVEETVDVQVDEGEEIVDVKINGIEEIIDAAICDGESDLANIIKTMYETLNNRILALESRLTQITASDCSDIQALGIGKSGVYTIYADRGNRPIDVFCDMDTEEGGWTIIQRRLPHSKEIDFDRGWYDYKIGFGNVSKDYWLGLENMHVLTNNRQYELRIELTDFEGGEAYAHYVKFYIEGESEGYRLHIGGYSGTSGDSLANEGTPDNFTSDNMMFTTSDNDHDTSHEINCAKYWKIGGWWYNRCSWANLNGPYKEPGEGDGIGINWHMWRNKQYLRSSTMMIRPTRNP